MNTPIPKYMKKPKMSDGQVANLNGFTPVKVVFAANAVCTDKSKVTIPSNSFFVFIANQVSMVLSIQHIGDNNK